MRGAHFFCEIRAGARIFRGVKVFSYIGRCSPHACRSIVYCVINIHLSVFHQFQRKLNPQRSLLAVFICFIRIAIPSLWWIRKFFFGLSWTFILRWLPNGKPIAVATLFQICKLYSNIHYDKKVIIIMAPYPSSIVSSTNQNVCKRHVIFDGISFDPFSISSIRRNVKFFTLLYNVSGKNFFFKNNDIIWPHDVQYFHF